MKVSGLEFIRFIIVGVINTCNYFVIYLILHTTWELNYMVSHAIGFSISLTISFYLNSYFTFQVKPTFLKILKFPLTQVINFTVSSVFVYLFVEFTYIDSTIAPLLSLIFTTPFTFIVTRKILKR